MPARIAEYQRKVDKLGLSDIFIKIKILNGGEVIIPYADLVIQPPTRSRTREYNSWVRKIIKLAADNGGWELYKRKVVQVTGEVVYEPYS